MIGSPAMPSEQERRLNRDRRRFSRGGRREYDREGYSPLILVVDEDAQNAARSEAILAALKFAVAPARTADEALAVMRALRPNLVVARVANPESFRAELERNELTRSVPVLVVTDPIASPENLIEAIREMLRSRATEEGMTSKK
jgi:PleD family two-component response regulator